MFDTMLPADDCVDWFCDRHDVNATDDVIDFVVDAHFAFTRRMMTMNTYSEILKVWNDQRIAS